MNTESPDLPKKKTRSTAPAKSKVKAGLFYVGIGASAGGLEALRPFVANLPEKSDMTFIVAQHMSPDHRSMMVELLARETKLTVLEAKTNTFPKANTVYVAPPDSDITISHGKIRLTKPQAAIGPKPSVDRLFLSLAEDQGEKAIGVIFSGTGSDGAHGIKAIKAAGGICIAQEPDTAKYDSMPKAAIRSGGVDLALTPVETAEQLASITTLPRVPIITEDEGVAPSTVRGIINQVGAHTGMDFSNYKDSTITRQLQRRMSALQIGDLEQYGQYTTDHHEELLELANNFLICVTSFFRDTESFAAIKKELAELIRAKEPGDDIRIWVPGCATGEEAYSLAILVCEELGTNIDKYRVQIFATDINNESTQYARKGSYPEASLVNMDEKFRKKYFTQKDRQYHVDKSLKDIVVFARQDIVQDPPFVRLDMVSCRNLLIYFKPELQDKVMRSFHYALRPNGIMFLGKSESIGTHSALFSEKNRTHKIFTCRNVPTPMTGHFAKAAPLTRSGKKSRVAPEDVKPSEMGHNRIFDLYAPASILIASDGSVIEFFGDCSPFIKINKGKADFNLFSIINPAFRSELRAFSHRVSRKKESAAGQPCVLSVDGGNRLYRLAVHFVGTQDYDSELLLVCFEKQPDKSIIPVSGDDETLEESAANRIAELQHELTSTRENLQTVVEELETSNEELQSLNEEAQAANEELQASNEELETSNEELQATNEELTTVNDELIVKTQELSEANSDLENIQASINKALIVVDKNLVVTRYNEKAEEFFKLTRSGPRENLTSVPTHFVLNDLIGSVRSVMQTGVTVDREFPMGISYYAIHIVPYVVNTSNTVQGAILTINDITEQKTVEERLRLSATVFEAASEATLITDQSNTILSVNPAFTRITGYKRDDVIGRKPDLLASGRHSKEFYKEMWTSLMDTGHWQGEIWNKRKNGDVYPEWLSINVLRDDRGKIMRHIAVFSDISDDKKAQEIIKKQASFDQLTGLPNRHLFFDRLRQAVQKGERRRNLVGLLFLDLDGFKSINDTLGHSVGDGLLKEAASRLSAVTRSSDTVGRLGGDEFTILLSDLVSVTDMTPTIDKVLAELSRPFDIEGNELHISGSIGATVYPDDGEDIESLLKNADSAMYSAKDAGRNTYRFFTKSMQDEAERRHRMANDIKNAHRDGGFEVHYQPILALDSGTVVGAEALMRWKHPVRGYISPDEFIPIAEETGMISELGNWVADVATQAAKQWGKAYGAPLYVALNKSTKQFRLGNFRTDWRSIIRKSHFPKENVIVEITESLMMSDHQSHVEYLNEMRQEGYRISLDDFGTGYSSLSYLKRLPVDLLKIDRSFIRDVTDDPDDAALVEAIIAMAHNLKIKVVAEGVETEAQMRFLQERACEFAQGYYFSKALPQEEFLRFLEARAAS
ncbi:hypothetical protein JCM17960_25550 [Magnetospira thiophila]